MWYLVAFAGEVSPAESFCKIFRFSNLSKLRFLMPHGCGWQFLFLRFDSVYPERCVYFIMY